MEERAAQNGFIRHKTRVFWIIVCAGMTLLALWASRSCAGGRQGSTTFKNSMQALATNPTEFVRSRITGGVGALLSRDTNSADLPVIREIIVGSPGDKAGLRMGDVITQINGATTTGQNLTAVVEAIRGFSMGSVAITVLRGETNRTRLDFVIRRDSMNTLLQPTNSYH